MMEQLVTNDLSNVLAEDFHKDLVDNFVKIQNGFNEVDLRTLLAYADDISSSAISNADFLTGKVDPWVPNTADSSLKIFSLNHENWLEITSTKTSPSTGAFTTLKMTDDTQHLAGLMQSIAFKIRCDAGGFFGTACYLSRC